MFNFTYNNHLKYTIGGRYCGFRTNSQEPFKVTVGAIDKDHYKKSSYQEELKRTADCVYRDYGKDFALMLSGGTDSEIVARNFLSIGVVPNCYVIKLKNGYNLYDVHQAVLLCKELNIPLQIIEFDVKDFMYSGEAQEFSVDLQCSQVTYLMVYKCIQKISLPAVMGGELLLTKHVSTNEDSYWYYTIRENEDCSAMRFSYKYGIPLVNEWFSYTPELILYWLTNPMIQNLVNTPDNYKLTSVSSKNKILTSLIPEIKWRVKTHGFERLLGFNQESYRELTSHQILSLEPSLNGIKYSEILTMLDPS